MGRKKATVRRSTTRRTAAKKATQRKSSGRSTGGLLQTATLVRDMQTVRKQLTAQRDKLDGEIRALDRALAEFGQGTRGAGSTGSGKVRTGSLKHYITEVLNTGGVMSVKDITAGVLDAGFKTKNKTLGTSVGIALSQMPNVKKVSRGKYGLS